MRFTLTNDGPPTRRTCDARGRMMEDQPEHLAQCERRHRRRNFCNNSGTPHEFRAEGHLQTIAPKKGCERQIVAGRIAGSSSRIAHKVQRRRTLGYGL